MKRCEKTLEAEKTLKEQTIPVKKRSYFEKMKGEKFEREGISYADSFVSLMGGFIAIILIATVALLLEYPYVIGPLGASTVLVFFVYQGAIAQPRNVIGGHFICTLLGLSVYHLFGASMLTNGLALAIVLIGMLLTDTFHPPAAASGLVALNFTPGWGMLSTITICAVILVVMGMLYNNIFSKRQYPKYWL